MSNIDDIPTWRTLLEHAIRPMGERQRIAQELGLNPVTLTRWASGQSLPRPEKLRALYDALPSLQESLLEAYPTLLQDERAGGADKTEIPSTFYDRILSGYVQLPRHLRQHALCTLLLQQILAQLDPKERGMGVFLAQCVPPRLPEDPVRSLRMTMGRTTRTWAGDIAQGTCFFGIESQAGNAVSHGHLLAAMSSEERERFTLPGKAYSPLQIESVMAVPIMQAECVAGCLCVFSPRSSAFSPAQLQLFEHYVHLLAVILPQEQFYPFSQIELALLPPFLQQLPVLQTFRTRVHQCMKQAYLAEKPIGLEEAERQTWQDIEQQLIEIRARQGLPEGDFS